MSRSLCYVAKAVACRCTEALSLQLFTHILVGTTLQIQKTDPDVAVFMPSTPYKVTCPDLFDMLKKLLHVVTKLRKSSLIAASIA